jgi:uncharacterized protein YjlB
LVILQRAFEPGEANLAERIEQTFHLNGWGRSWRNGIYSFHHYHSTAHEVLGLYAGEVNVLFGGPNGRTATAKAGDVILIPAGVSHKNVGQSPDFQCVGAYPEGQIPDMQYGRPDERPQVDQDILSVALPVVDPVYGKSGPLLEIWA